MEEKFKAAIIGNPAHHSKSPLIHQYWANKYGFQLRYEAIDISPENLSKEFLALISDMYMGFSVTLPHKQNIMKLCDNFDDVAKAINAVNMIYIKDQKICGSNTDAFGFIESIRQAVPAYDFKALPAVVLGAGGAARAVVYGLLREGAQVFLINRTREKAKQVADEMSCFGCVSVFDWSEKEDALTNAGLLANTTPLGMDGFPDLDINLDNLPETAVVSDVVYVPLRTSLLKQAASRGNPVVNGLGMLLHQARPAFKTWFGVMPDIDDELQSMILK
ncbi:MAG: shikimate dehydrogenase [Alphaproteobacteria bacterium]|nr:shikimate dehydrogenase [Alphaproteobacteria bacterium]